MTSYLCIENRLEDATLTASSEAAGYPVSRIATGVLGDSWKAAAGGPQWVKAAYGSAVAIGYLALFAHNLDEVGASVMLQHSDDDVTYTDALGAAITPTNKQMIFRLVSAGSHAYWRLNITGASAAPYIAFASIGQALALPKGPRVGFAPPLTVGLEIEDGVSRGGWLLSMSRYLQPESLTIEQERVDPSWVDTYWPQIHRRVTKRPFVFAWDVENHPDQAYYCWPASRLAQPRWATPTRKSFSLQASALISTGLDE